MDKINFNLLKNISETPGASGFESPIRELIKEEIQSYCDKITVDNMGNLTAFRKGTSDMKLMIAAHMDEIGFIVNYIDDNGFLRFNTLGGFDPKTLTAQRVIVHGKKDLVGVMGTKPVHMMDEEERKKMPKTKDFFIDLGMDKEEVEKYIEPGDPVTRERECIRMGNCINGKSLDNRISVYILSEVIKEIADINPELNIYAVFTVQEELGLRGAQVAALEIEPDLGIGLDTTIAFDVPGAQAHETVTKLGDGAAIKIMDASAIADKRMIDFMKKTAKENDIKYQTEIMAAGGTDTAFIQRMNKSGAITGAVSIPTRHIHQVIESVNEEDIISGVNLLRNSILSAGKYNWSY